MTIEHFHWVVVPSRINEISAEIIAKSIFFKGCHKSFVVSLYLPFVGPAVIYFHVGTKWLDFFQTNVFFSWCGCVYLMLERDEETHGGVFFTKGIGSVVEFHSHCYWNCHINFHLFLIFSLDVFEETPESLCLL